MKALFSIPFFCFLLCASAFAGSDVYFKFSDFSDSSAYFTNGLGKMRVKMTSAITVRGTNTVLKDWVDYSISTNGDKTVTNMAYGIYTVQLTAKNTESPFQITITNGAASTLNAKDLITTSTNTPEGTTAYSIAAANNRFVTISNGVSYGQRFFPTNGAPPNNGMVWTATGTNGSGAWSNSTGSASGGYVFDPAVFGVQSATNIFLTNGLWLTNLSVRGTLTATNITDKITTASNALWTAQNNRIPNLDGISTNLFIRSNLYLASMIATNWIYQHGNEFAIEFIGSNGATHEWLIYTNTPNAQNPYLIIPNPTRFQRDTYIENGRGHGFGSDPTSGNFFYITSDQDDGILYMVAPNDGSSGYGFIYHRAGGGGVANAYFQLQKKTSIGLGGNAYEADEMLEVIGNAHIRTNVIVGGFLVVTGAVSAYGADIGTSWTNAILNSTKFILKTNGIWSGTLTGGVFKPGNVTANYVAGFDENGMLTNLGVVSASLNWGPNTFGWDGGDVFSYTNGSSRIWSYNSDDNKITLHQNTAAAGGFEMPTGDLGLAAGVVNANGFNSQGSVSNTAGVNFTINRYAGRVNLAAGQQSAFVTNSLITTDSIVVATVNSDDAVALSAKAIPSTGLLTLKLNGVAAANTKISFNLITP